MNTPENPKKPAATRESAKAMYDLYQWMFGNPLPPFDIYLATIITQQNPPN